MPVRIHSKESYKNFGAEIKGRRVEWLLFRIQCICCLLQCWRSLLLRRFVFRMAEASAKQVTGDEPQGTMGRVQAPVVSFPPSFARTISSKERRLGTRQMLTVYNNRPYLKGGHVFPFPSAKVKGQINVHFSLRSQQQRVWWIHHESTVNQEKALCLHCQLVSCFSDFFWLCGKSLLSCESISTHCPAPRETVRVRCSLFNRKTRLNWEM